MYFYLTTQRKPLNIVVPSFSRARAGGATRPCLHALVVVLAAPEQCPCCVHGRKTSDSPSTFATRPSKAESKPITRSSEAVVKAGAQRTGLATTMRKFCLALFECGARHVSAKMGCQMRQRMHAGRHLTTPHTHNNTDTHNIFCVRFFCAFLCFH